MPIVSSTFDPPWWLCNGHLQTILPVVWPSGEERRAEPERLELPDGDFLDLGWRRGGNQRVVILSHGLEGNADAKYITAISRALIAAGWDALAWNFRGCGLESNRLARFYHSGETGDLGALVEHAAKYYQTIALIGISLGGNVTLKYLGEAAPHRCVCAGIAISAPVDLAASARELDRRLLNRVYLRRFIKTLVAKVRAKAERFPAQFDVKGLEKGDDVSGV